MRDHSVRIDVQRDLLISNFLHIENLFSLANWSSTILSENVNSRKLKDQQISGACFYMKPNIKTVYENIDISRLIGVRGEIKHVIKVWKYEIRYTRMTIYLTQVVWFPNSKSTEHL